MRARPWVAFLLLPALLIACRPAAEETPPGESPVNVATAEITVYFADTNLYATAAPPFEVGVPRTGPASADLPRAVLEAYFDGPTAEEQARGLIAITSGFTGVAAVQVEGGIARVYLQGPCQSMGATYTIAQPILRNLLQFEEIDYVKIYDGNGETEEPEGPVNSIPFCLEP